MVATPSFLLRQPGCLYLCTVAFGGLTTRLRLLCRHVMAIPLATLLPDPWLFLIPDPLRFGSRIMFAEEGNASSFSSAGHLSVGTSSPLSVDRGVVNADAPPMAAAVA